MNAPVGNSIDLGRCASPWAVEEGAVHVFATRRRPAASAAPRRLLFTVTAPGILLPMPGDPALVITAAPMPGSRLTDLAPARLWADPQADGVLDRWVEGWLEACARPIAHRPGRDLVAGDGPRADLPPGRILNADRKLVWLRSLSGEGVLLDSEPVGGPGLTLVPLAGAAWLRSFSDMHLRPVATARLIAEGEMPGAIAAFHGAALRALALALDLARVDEATRWDLQADRLTSDISRVMGDLGRMIGAIAPERGSGDTHQDLLTAVHAVSTRVGIRAQSPSSISDDEADQGASLDRILDASGLRARRLFLTDGWWRKGVGDFVAYHRDTGAPRAVLDRGGKGQVLLEPATGRRRKVTPDLAATLSPDAYALYQPLPDTRITMTTLYLFGLQGARGDLLTILLATALGSCVSGLPAIGSKLIFETLVPQHFAGLLLQVGLALALVAACRSIFTYASFIAFARIRARASARLKAALWDRVLRQNMTFLSRFQAPDLTMRVVTLENIVHATHTLAHQSLAVLLMLAVNLGTLFWLAPGPAGAAAGLIALFGAAIGLGAWGQKLSFKKGEQSEGSVSTFVHALTNGVRKLRLAGAEERAFVKWGDRFTRSRMKLVNLRRVTNLFNGFAAGYEFLALAAVLTAAALMPAESMPVGTFFAFIIAFQTCMSAMANMGRQVMNVAFQFASIPYGQPILDAAPEREARKANPGRLSGAVELSGITHRYGPDGEPVLRNLDLSVRPGEFVAIVGPTGCGKSTLVKLLLGLERPAAGAVLYDQRDLAGLDAGAVRHQIGTVLQRTQLPPGSIHDVIRADGAASLDETWAAAVQAGLGPDIEAMPMGMHTAVPEGAHGFSGGQLQRLAIARAIVRKPAILILDEATSALDNLTQAEVTRNLAALSCTRIVIAHRLSTITGADRIIVLDGGKVAEAGTYTELAQAGGLFAAMAARQQLH
ncbi:ATP-binding cassette domain-containing protein [Nitrospirillum sp. BR 11163]|uniref:ATP-binding cassette domain-containing protein n=1 Tax=Nitrospirillum sp. BR 11163 TaxID=3104323 RepID=UPI002AFFAC0A|nr:ATP-binding cassette domain-containing protein [Nitrospirillum sp. BR 11163]MEA1672864.1 ATP-binding cassette domain-containing protein [Nitrospirillum sp. BR 11163]